VVCVFSLLAKLFVCTPVSLNVCIYVFVLTNLWVCVQVCVCIFQKLAKLYFAAGNVMSILKLWHIIICE
jgi:hypothetical protein